MNFTKRNWKLSSGCQEEIPEKFDRTSKKKEKERCKTKSI
jgi:hypothetical protein